MKRLIGHTLREGWMYQRELWGSRWLAAIDYTFYLLDCLIYGKKQ